MVAKKLADLIFLHTSRKLCSWTGVSPTKNVEKKTEFQTFNGILDFFFNLVHKADSADSRWTVNFNEKFFEVIYFGFKS